MSNEIQAALPNAITAYAQVYTPISGQIWNGTGFQNYSSLSGQVATYPIPLTQQGVAGPMYMGNMFSGFPGTYNILALQKINAFYSESDPVLATGQIEWDGQNVVPLISRASSGQVGQGQPLQLARSWQTLNWPIYLKSAADHITPFTGATGFSGQISRDGGAFGPLQSGAFTEIGLGFYALQALTSGDLNAGTIALLFTAVNGSGSADPLPQAFRLQRISGTA